MKGQPYESSCPWPPMGYGVALPLSINGKRSADLDAPGAAEGKRDGVL